MMHDATNICPVSFTDILSGFSLHHKQTNQNSSIFPIPLQAQQKQLTHSKKPPSYHTAPYTDQRLSTTIHVYSSNRIVGVRSFVSPIECCGFYRTNELQPSNQKANHQHPICIPQKNDERINLTCSKSLILSLLFSGSPPPLAFAK